MKLNWATLTIDDLTTRQLLDIMIIRADVFVVEQQCIYNDPDTYDVLAHHCCGYEGTTLVAYSRILPHASRFSEPSIGRVLTSQEHRGLGYGKELVRYSISECSRLFPHNIIHISAQCYLEKFYCDLGFVVCSEEYKEDGIWHIEMELAPVV